MKRYYVYILKCSDNSYYTGITNDIEKRMQYHTIGVNPDSYTYSRRPVELVFHTEFNDVNQAIAFEKQVKGWSRKKLLLMMNGKNCQTYQKEGNRIDDNSGEILREPQGDITLILTGLYSIEIKQHLNSN